MTKNKLLSRYSGVLRNTTAVLAVCLLFISQTAYAQNGKVLMPARSATVRQALDEIARQTDYKVVVMWEYLNAGRTVSLPSNEIQVKDLLAVVLKDTGHTWKEESGRIIITHVPQRGNGRGMVSAIARDDFNNRQMTFIADPWSRTQKPIEDMANTRVARMSANPGGRDSTSMAVVNFRVNSSTVERDYMNNAHALDMLGRTFQRRDILAGVDYIVITAGSSPEGRETVNEKLAAERALAVKSYIMWKFPFLDRDMIYTFSIGEDWTGLRKLVEQDYYTPNRDEVLALLDSHHDNDSKKAALKTIGGGRSYSYIAQHMLPKLRGGAALTLHYKEEPKTTIVKIEEKILRDTVYIDRLVEPVQEPEPVVESEAEAAYEKKALFAIKTNLLFDVASAINVEVEIPIGKRWSVAGEWIFPWWLHKKKQYALQVGNGNLELKYWFGDRESRRQLTGWFIGLYGGAGYYDLEWKDKGYQGEFWHTGLSGGYAHTISRNGNWRMEYTLGLGYMESKYHEYEPEYGTDDKWHLIEQRSGLRRWIGPTRAKISLVWMINHGYNKKGGAK